MLEATGGDSSILWIDTVVIGITVHEFVGGWPVDSMDLVDVIGLPNGLILNCDELDPNVDNCMLPGNYLTCAFVGVSYFSVPGKG